MTNDLHTKWAHRWITKKAKAYKSSIHGLGVIAVKNITKGEIVGILGGVIVPKGQIHEYHLLMGDVGIQIDKHFFIAPTSREELVKAGVFNHSCNPNCGYSGQITLVALRDIKKGEELTFDYAFSESFMKSFRCSCGSRKCRKTFKPTDWRLPNLQKKYGSYYNDYLKERIQKMRR